MKNTIVFASLLIASVAFGADAKKKMAAPAAAPAAIKADVTGSLKWTGYGVGKSHSGDLNIKNGFIDMKGDEIVGGMVTLDMASLKTADSEKLQGHLQSADFFDVQKFPEGTFKITNVEAIKGAKAPAATHKITGDLTIKGRTHSETLLATVNKAGTNKWNAKAETEIKDRTQYDIVYNSAKFKTASALGDKLIEDKIKIEMNLATK